MNARTLTLTLGLLAALWVGAAYLLHPAPCTVSIHYRLGTVDPRFGVSTERLMADIAEAVAIWGEPLSVPLFVYDPKGPLTVNLVYDDRQAITEEEQRLTADIKETTAVADSVKAEYETLRAKYEDAERLYKDRLARFTARQSLYNAEVSYWNDRGGAPKAEYEKLEQERQELVTEQQALEAARLSVNALADDVNAYIKKYNLLIGYINKNINTINTDGLAGTQFEEGVYISDKAGARINIYQFADKTDLVRVLAHEFGHALGLGHNDNKNSIMNPVNASNTLRLSADDAKALRALCASR